VIAKGAATQDTRAGGPARRPARCCSRTSAGPVVDPPGRAGSRRRSRRTARGLAGSSRRSMMSCARLQDSASGDQAFRSGSAGSRAGRSDPSASSFASLRRRHLHLRPRYRIEPCRRWMTSSSRAARCATASRSRCLKRLGIDVVRSLRHGGEPRIPRAGAVA